MAYHIGSPKYLEPISTGFLGHFVDKITSFVNNKSKTTLSIVFFKYGGNIGSALSGTDDQLHLIIRPPGRHLFTFVPLISSSKPKASTRVRVGWNSLEIRFSVAVLKNHQTSWSGE